jgi:hypothetical protein
LRSNPNIPSLHRRLAIGACAALIALSLMLSYSAVQTKSATYDEPLHLLSGWLQLHLDDSRLNFEDPPLPKLWASLPNGADAILFNPADPAWLEVAGNFYREWDVTTDTLYRTPVNDSISLLSRARLMMVLLVIPLGIVAAVWAWRLGGPRAAVMACVLLALDPGVLGHAPLVKNDVAMALVLCATFLAAFEAGRRLTWRNGIAVCVLVALALNTKFSALLLGPMLVLLFVLRALVNDPWLVFGHHLARRSAKFAAAAALLLAIAVVSYIGIWAGYGFRFGPSPDPRVNLNFPLRQLEVAFFKFRATHPHPRPLPLDPNESEQELRSTLQDRLQSLTAALNQARAAVAGSTHIPDDVRAQIQSSIRAAEQMESNLAGLLNGSPTSPPSDLRQRLHDADVDAQNTEYQTRFVQYWASLPNGADVFTAAIGFMLSHHLLPEPWLHGVMVQYSHSMARGTYLLGQVDDVGRWYYFPVAMGVKTPVATLLTLLLALAIGVAMLRVRREDRRELIWPIACLAVPVVVYLGAAMASSLNLGLRHVLPVYPLLYIGSGAILAEGTVRWRTPLTLICALLGVMLLCETLLAWPNYIAYFNFAVGGTRGGLRLLGDSNLDWGQDLPALAKWEKEHPGVPVALAYFGTADPAAYGVKFDLLPPWPPDEQVKKTHVLAVGATYLQGVHSSNFIGYRSLTPSAVLGGGTIYLYDLRNAP